jgi:hypothetical protein
MIIIKILLWINALEVSALLTEPTALLSKTSSLLDSATLEVKLVGQETAKLLDTASSAASAAEHGANKMQISAEHGVNARMELVNSHAATTRASATAAGTAFDKAAVKAAFVQEQNLLASTQIIPAKKSATSLRFVTFNVENLKDTQGVLTTIQKTNPDVFVLQEVPDKNVAALSADLKKQGYSHTTKCMNFRIGAGMLGNVIYSKHPFRSTHSYGMFDPYGRRCLVEALVATPSGDILTLGTHLSNKGTAFRSYQMNKITALATARRDMGINDQILLADMNGVSNRFLSTPGSWVSETLLITHHNIFCKYWVSKINIHVDSSKYHIHEYGRFQENSFPDIKLYLNFQELFKILI